MKSAFAKSAELSQCAMTNLNQDKVVSMNVMIKVSKLFYCDIVDVMDSTIARFGDDVVTYANDLNSFRVIVNIAVSPNYIDGYSSLRKCKNQRIR